MPAVNFMMNSGDFSSVLFGYQAEGAVFGGLQPSEYIEGHWIRYLHYNNSSGLVRLSIGEADPVLPQGYFDTLSINGTVYNSADATYASNLSTTWEWSAPNPFVTSPDGSTYDNPIIFVLPDSGGSGRYSFPQTANPVAASAREQLLRLKQRIAQLRAAGNTTAATTIVDAVSTYKTTPSGSVGPGVRSTYPAFRNFERMYYKANSETRAAISLQVDDIT